MMKKCSRRRIGKKRKRRKDEKEEEEKNRRIKQNKWRNSEEGVRGKRN